MEKNTPEMDELFDLLNSRKFSELMRRIDEYNPMDAADFLQELPSEQIPLVFRLLKKDTAAEIFAELDADLQKLIIDRMTDREISAMLDELYTDDAVDMLEEMPANVVKRIMATATPQTRNEINRFLSYPERSAGSVMTSEFIDLRANMTCEEAVTRIRRIGLDKETVYVAYVTNASRVLQGVVELKQLLFADPKDIIGEIMDKNIVFASTHDDREDVANLISRYDIIALPIVDLEQRLVGIVTVDDALDVLETEATEDIEKMAAILPSDKPYLKTGVWETWKKRVPWLLLLMISATFTGAIITHYETAIGTYAILTAFFPMLMNTGGNAGGQTSATVIRGLSLGEIEPRDIFRVLWKEIRVGALCGLALGIASFAKTMLVDFHLQRFTTLESGAVQDNVLISLIISATVFSAIVIAKTVGTLFPLGAKRIGLDPTVIASPFITTVLDTLTLMIYFAIASAMLGF